MPSYVIKWSGDDYAIDVEDSQTVADLKNLIFNRTGVRPDRQKLLGLKVAGGKPAADETAISDLNLKPNSKIMLMGSREEDIAQASERPEGLPEVVNDLDIPEEAEIAIQNQSEYLSKIEKRVRDIKVEVLNPPRPGKKLLVLDIDYTLFDHRSVAESPDQLMRPFLHEFLTSAYDDYDIVIWSATSMKWIDVKMRQLGVLSNPNYRIAFMLDSSSMICLHSPEYGFLDVKPLGVIWGKFPDFYDPHNTIMFDDIRRNFLMNPQNGLRIRPFREAHKNRDTDTELVKLAKYLRVIAQLDNLSILNHKHWERFLRDNT